MVTIKHFYKAVSDGYIEHVGYGYGAPEISEEEYQCIRKLLLNAPETEEGQEARLREDLSWEIVPREEYERITEEQEAMNDASDVRG